MQMTVIVGTKVNIEASESHQIRIVSYVLLRQVKVYVKIYKMSAIIKINKEQRMSFINSSPKQIEFGNQTSLANLGPGQYDMDSTEHKQLMSVLHPNKRRHSFIP